MRNAVSAIHEFSNITLKPLKQGYVNPSKRLRFYLHIMPYLYCNRPSKNYKEEHPLEYIWIQSNATEKDQNLNKRTAKTQKMKISRFSRFPFY